MSTQTHRSQIASNRRARYDYFIDDTMEAGVVLSGSEVKSLRCNGGNINDAYVDTVKGEIFLVNAYIKEYEKARLGNHSARRHRKLLLHKSQIKKLSGLIKIKGTTIVPLSMYFNDKNIVKIEIAIVRGKKAFDKRETIKEREWNRSKQRLEAL